MDRLDGPDQPGGPRRPGGPFGIDLPAVQDEMRRHREEMRAIMEGARPLMMEVQKKIRELREQGADREAIKKALEDLAPKRGEIAGKMADALITHQANLAKIFQENRDAVADALAENLTRRLATGPRRPGGPGGEGFRPRGGPGEGGPGFRPRRPAGPDEEPEDAPPANF
jgi:hypothetical protein